MSSATFGVTQPSASLWIWRRAGDFVDTVGWPPSSHSPENTATAFGTTGSEA